MKIDTARLRALAKDAVAAEPNAPWFDPESVNPVGGVEPYDAASIAAADPPTMLALLDEIERLRQWKAEAMDVLSEWEKAWIAAGRPGRLGTSKAAGVREEIERLWGDTEWEYGVEHVQVDGWVDRELHLNRQEALDDYRTCGMNCSIMRRRKAGPWEPVTGDDDD